MLTEFKRDNKQRDYERMSEDLNRRKRELKSYEDQLRSRTGDILQMDQSHLDDKVSTTFQSCLFLMTTPKESCMLLMTRFICIGIVYLMWIWFFLCSWLSIFFSFVCCL